MISIVTQRQHPHQVFWLDAMAQGIKRHGINVERLTEMEIHLAGDVAVCWGWRIGLELFRPNPVANVLVMERGYIGNRRSWSGCGWNGLNGRADFVNENSPPDRFADNFADLMQPWKDGGDYILLMGQVPGDQSVAHLDIRGWYQAAIEACSALDMPVMFRAHPMAGSTPTPDGAIGLSGELSSALAGAAAVITCNSNSGVDAALAGVPVYALDEGSMAWDVARHDVTQDPIRPDRSQWASNLAYAQWNLYDVQTGVAWEHLGRFLK